LKHPDSFVNDPATSVSARLALSALEPVAAHFSLGLTPRAVGQSLGWQPATMVTLQEIRWAAQALGLKARPIDLRRRAGRRFGFGKPITHTVVPVPCMLLGSDEKIATVVARRSAPVSNGTVSAVVDTASQPSPNNTEEFLLWEPGNARFRWVGVEELAEEYGRLGALTALVFHQPLRLGSQPGGSLPRFGLAWFVPMLWRYRKPLGQVLLGAFLLQLVALTTPLFSQVIIDKVLMHKSLSTLHVLGIGMAGLIVFEAVTSVLRGYMLAHTSSRLDAGLSSDLFRHLLSLPLRYFEQRQAGDTLARTRELENIRGFSQGAHSPPCLTGCSSASSLP
jgi:ATP-binding cassette, subfamily B, bacterial HlyB/CyaB